MPNNNPEMSSNENTTDQRSLLRDKLGKSRQTFGRGLGKLLLGQRQLNDELVEEIETVLISSDVGLQATQTLVDEIVDRAKRKELTDTRAVYRYLRESLQDILRAHEQSLTIPEQEMPFVIMAVGVNGVGKTTTCGKLALKLKNDGLNVMLAAADTFRAAAVEQLQVWGQRLDIPVIAQQTGADAGAVTHDAMQAAKARKTDVLIVDTAGRQHTDIGLMDELVKVKRVISKLDADAPHEVLLVLDAGTGQNALSQLKHFNNTVSVTGLVLTKLDGTAKGGVLVGLAGQGNQPVRFIGVGEKAEDLRCFNADEFVDALLPDEGSDR
ncbi:MAG: signal recognition particle-docking protein FtsY [Acidiferrobacterales bacterium]